MQFLWIRWLGPEPGWRSGWKPLCLDRIGFVGAAKHSPNFGFLDPANVIRAAHLLPAFAYGRTREFLGPLLIRHLPEDDDDDWESFYVNRYGVYYLQCYTLTLLYPDLLTATCL